METSQRVSSKLFVHTAVELRDELEDVSGKKRALKWIPSFIHIIIIIATTSGVECEELRTSSPSFSRVYIRALAIVGNIYTHTTTICVYNTTDTDAFDSFTVTIVWMNGLDCGFVVDVLLRVANLLIFCNPQLPTLLQHINDKAKKKKL